MKKTVVLILLMTAVCQIMAQAKKQAAGNPAPKTPVLKTTEDSLSYAIGLSVAKYCKDQGIESVSAPLLAKAINDLLKNGTQQMSDQQANNIFVAYVQKMKAEKAAENKKAGEAFLAANKNNPGVVTLPSGLQYVILKEGNGPKPTVADKIKCNYEGKLLDGTIFDSSIKQGGPIELSVGGVIQGWTEALQLMPVGSKWRLFVPSGLAYGDQQAGPFIKPGSTLIFELELLEIVK
ncbi:MAG TPA: FKBP-type peptidyl-prolyl cis-trans isomerase [Puia sp.]|nr:FKBP-type peptidyl-prolyl cis-trans isomerase [Puia sp.]